MSNRRSSLTEDEKRAINRVLTVLEPFEAIRSTMPLHQVIAYLRVALDEGNSVIEYARKSGKSQSVMSRHLLDIGSTHRSGEQGLGLVEARPSPDELRRHEVILSDKGRQLAHKIARIISQ